MAFVHQQYAPQLQLKVTGLDRYLNKSSNIKLLDFGCGENAGLLKFLQESGISNAEGIDAFGPAEQGIIRQAVKIGQPIPRASCTYDFVVACGVPIFNLAYAFSEQEAHDSLVSNWINIVGAPKRDYEKRIMERALFNLQEQNREEAKYCINEILRVLSYHGKALIFPGLLGFEDYFDRDSSKSLPKVNHIRLKDDNLESMQKCQKFRTVITKA